MAWSAPNHYLNKSWNIINWTIRNKIKWNLYRYSYVFLQENAFKNVAWKTATALSRPRYINSKPVLVHTMDWRQTIILLKDGLVFYRHVCTSELGNSLFRKWLAIRTMVSQTNYMSIDIQPIMCWFIGSKYTEYIFISYNPLETNHRR